MKICILSMQMVQNMGSLLQCYALRKILEEMGNKVSFLPIEHKDEDDALMKEYKISFSEESNFKKYINKLKYVNIYFFNYINTKKKNKEQNRKYDDFRKNILRINGEKKEKKLYDWCVIGSDEVFNCSDSSPWGFTTQLFGNVAEANNTMTYAASCGATTVETIPTGACERIASALKKLKTISVRDKNTEEFVRIISGMSAEINLDPVLIGNFDDEILTSKEVTQLSTKYCVVYAYHYRIYKKQEINAIKKFCRSHNLVPVAVGMPQFWIKEYIVADPFQCLKIFRRAEFVITDTFHGTIFSAKYCLRFATIVRDSNRNKLQDLIDRIHVSDHQISAITIDELERAYTKVHNKESFNKMIAAERARTLSYLKENLKEDI